MSTKQQFFIEVEATQPARPIDTNDPTQALKPGQARHYSGTTATGRVLRTLNMDMAEIFDQVKACIDLAAARICPGPGGPAETAVEFGIKISAEGNVVIATVGSEVHLKVSAKWACPK